MNADEKCGFCGRDPAEGFATLNMVRFCHGNEEETTCYMRAQALGVAEVDVLVTMPAMRKRLDALLGRETPRVGDS